MTTVRIEVALHKEIMAAQEALQRGDLIGAERSWHALHEAVLRQSPGHQLVGVCLNGLAESGSQPDADSLLDHALLSPERGGIGKPGDSNRPAFGFPALPPRRGRHTGPRHR